VLLVLFRVKVIHDCIMREGRPSLIIAFIALSGDRQVKVHVTSTHRHPARVGNTPSAPPIKLATDKDLW